MPAEEHIHYAPESPAVDNRAVLLCALGALILLAGAIFGLHEVYRRGVPVKDCAGPASLSAAARRHQPSRSRGAPAPRRRAAGTPRNLALGERSAHPGADTDRARHAAPGAKGRGGLRPAVAAAAAGEAAVRIAVRQQRSSVCWRFAPPAPMPATAGVHLGAACRDLRHAAAERRAAAAADAFATRMEDR